MTNLDITMTKTDRNLWNAIIGEAMALLKYNAYAIKALEEGHPEIAQIFQESAGAENIHGNQLPLPAYDPRSSRRGPPRCSSRLYDGHGQRALSLGILHESHG